MGVRHRWDMVRLAVGAAVLLPLAMGGSHSGSEPDYPNLDDCPFPVDPNLVVGRLLGWFRIEVGQEFIHTRTWHDAEGDPARVEIVNAPEGVQIINRPKVCSYTLIWTPRQTMTAAIVVRVTDRPLHAEPMSSTGTLLVQVVPRSSGLVPKGCGGPPR